MSFKLKLFDKNIIRLLKTKLTLKRDCMCDYSMFVRSEFSRVRLTHDIFDNHFYLDSSIITQSDCYGLANQEVKSKSR